MKSASRRTTELAKIRAHRLFAANSNDPTTFVIELRLIWDQETSSMNFGEERIYELDILGWEISPRDVWMAQTRAMGSSYTPPALTAVRVRCIGTHCHWDTCPIYTSNCLIFRVTSEPNKV